MNWPRGKVQEFINEITLMSLFKRILKTNMDENEYHNILRVSSLKGGEKFNKLVSSWFRAHQDGMSRN